MATKINNGITNHTDFVAANIANIAQAIKNQSKRFSNPFSLTLVFNKKSDGLKKC